MEMSLIARINLYLACSSAERGDKHPHKHTAVHAQAHKHPSCMKTKQRSTHQRGHLAAALSRCVVNNISVHISRFLTLFLGNFEVWTQFVSNEINKKKQTDWKVTQKIKEII